MAKRNDFSATASQTVFTYTFQIFETSEIDVYQNGTLLTETTHYTVSNSTLPTIGGTVTLVTGATVGDLIALVQNIPVERLIDYQTNGDMRAEDLDADFDRIYTFLDDGLPGSELSTRLVRFADSEDRSGNDNLIPSPETGKFLGWAADGDLVNIDAPDVSAGEAPVVANIAALKSLDTGEAIVAYVQGTSSINDGGQSWFYYDSGSAAADNGTTIIEPNSGTGRWLILQVATLGIKDLNVTTAKIAASAVTTAKIAADAVDKTKIAADIAGSGLSQAAGGELNVNVDASTIEINSDTLRVKALGITSNQLAADAVTNEKIANDAVGTSEIIDESITTGKMAKPTAANDNTIKRLVGSGGILLTQDDSYSDANKAYAMGQANSNDTVGFTCLVGGDVRIRLTHTVANATGYWRVVVNGTELVERTTTTGQSPKDYDEDITLTRGDAVLIQHKSGSGVTDTSELKNVRITSGVNSVAVA